jgi:CHAT domain-containing protein
MFLRLLPALFAISFFIISCQEDPQKPTIASKPCCDYLFERYTIMLSDTTISDTARQCIQDGVELAKEYPFEMATCVFLEGDEYLMIQDYPNAKEYFEWALDIGLTYPELGDKYLAECYNRLGLIYQETYDLDAAVQAFKKSLTYYYNLNDSLQVMIGYNGLANIYGVVGFQYELAKIYYDSVQMIYKAIEDKSETMQQMYAYSENTRANAFLKESVFYQLLGDQKAVDSLSRKALSIHLPLDQIIEVNNIKGDAAAINSLNIALGYYIREQADSSNIHANRAIAQRDNVQPFIIGHAFTIKGNAYRLLNKSDKSLAANNTSLELLGMDLSNDFDIPSVDIDSIVNPTYLIGGLNYRMKLWQVLYEKTGNIKYLEALLNTANTITNIIEQKRDILLFDNSAASFNAQIPDIHHTISKAAYDLYLATKKQKYLDYSFQMVERGKSYVLKRKLRQKSGTQYSGVLGELYRKEERLRLAAATSENPQKAQSRYESFIEELKNSSDLNARRFYAELFENDILSLKHIQSKVIDEQTAILEFDTRGKDIRCFIISKDTTSLVTISKQNGKLYKLISLYNRTLDPELLGSTSYSKVAHDLYNLLFKDIQRQIPSKVNRLIIVPDIMLYDVVFDNLLTESTNAKAGYQQLPYLLKDYAISYSHSITVDERYSRFASESETTYDFGFFVSNFENAKRDEEQWCNVQQLTVLDEAAKAVKSTLEKKNQKVFYWEPARKTDYLAHASKCKVLHFSTHACLDNLSVSSSRILFTPTSRNDQDDILTVPEIEDTNLTDARLAVLINCNTNQGIKQVGEGTMSIARAFFSAGCPSVIASTRLVRPQAGPIIPLLYEYLLSNVPKDVALQQAKLTYLRTADKKHLHPMFWGNIILLGNSQPL